MKKILFPTDLSEAANKAFIYALHLADKLEAVLYTLHVYQKPEVRAGGLPHTLQEFYESYDLEEFKNFKDSIPSLRAVQEEHGFSHLHVSHTLKGGSKIVATILEVAEKEQPDMIVMGTTGARGLKEIFLGSVAGEVLENAHCPVLAVPESAEFDGELDTVGMAVSFNDEEKLALNEVLDIIGLFKPDIYCVHVDMAHTEEYTHKMEAFAQEFAAHSNIHFEVVEGNDFQGTLTKYLEGKAVDLVAMVAHKRNFLEELFRYSRTKKMSYHSSIPVLSVPSHILE